MTRFSGTLVLSELALRTDRFRIAAWSIVVAGSAFLLASRSSATVVSSELADLIMVPVAVMAVVLATPHLRGAEQSGRLELMSSGVVGRYATLTGGLSSAVAAVVCSGALLLVALTSAGFDVPSSAQLATEALVAGIVAVGLAALTSQLAESAAAASGLALVVIALACFLRAVTTAPQSGIGMHGWWPSTIGVIVALALLAIAYRAAGRRDLGSGFGPFRGQRGQAALRPTSALRLAVGQQKWPLIAWSSAVLGICVTAGNLVGRAPETTAAVSSPRVASAPFLVLVALFASGYAIHAVRRAVDDEERGVLDTLLSVPMSRSTWFGAQLAVTACAATWLALVGGIGFAATVASAHSDIVILWTALPAVLHLLPAIAVIIGMAVWCHGHAPLAIGALWVYLGYVTSVAVFQDVARLGDVPEWAGIVSPFAHLPLLPAETFSAGPPIVLAGIAGVFTVLGVEGYRRRDIERPEAAHR